MSEGYCKYQFNPHEVYANPEHGFTCGATTYTAADRDEADPYCPEHGGTPKLSDPVSSTPSGTSSTTSGTSSSSTTSSGTTPSS